MTGYYIYQCWRLIIEKPLSLLELVHVVVVRTFSAFAHSTIFVRRRTVSRFPSFTCCVVFGKNNFKQRIRQSSHCFELRCRLPFLVVERALKQKRGRRARPCCLGRFAVANRNLRIALDADEKQESRTHKQTDAHTSEGCEKILCFSERTKTIIIELRRPRNTRWMFARTLLAQLDDLVCF